MKEYRSFTTKELTMNISFKFQLLKLLYAVVIVQFVFQLSYAQNKTDKLDELIKTYATYDEFNGAVLVAEEGKVLYKKGFGMANMEWNIPNQTNTKFRIASITKQFTAVIIAQLVREGKLDFDLSISNYLPDYPKERADLISIHHLLTHSSGTPEYSFEERRYETSEMIKLISESELRFEPGSKFEYSNSGYNVLGFIIETITKKSYEENLQERIFRPLNMTNSGFDRHRPIIKDRAIGYFKTFGEYKNANYIDMSKVYAAGAIYTTVEDLFIWDQALYSEKLLPRKYIDILFDKHIKDPYSGGHYAYGWEIKEKPIGNSDESRNTIGHDGVINGFCAIFTRVPSDNKTIILLSNVRRAPLNAMTKGIMGILYEKTYNFPKKSVANNLSKEIDKNGIKQGLKFYHKVKNLQSYYLSEDEMNVAAYKLIQNNQVEQALSVLELNIQAFPEAFNVYDSYGEALLLLGRKEEAIANYKKSIILNPKNKNAVRILHKQGYDENELRLMSLDLIDMDKSWGSEIFKFPLNFAPEIELVGGEDARFSPDWSKKDSAGYWSYAFAWHVDTETALSKDFLEENIRKYFDGLMKGVNKERGKILPKTVAIFKENSKKSIYPSYSGEVKVHDSFFTRDLMTLHVKVENHFCEESKKSMILFKFSPKNYDHKIWSELDEIKITDVFCKP